MNRQTREIEVEPAGDSRQPRFRRTAPIPGWPPMGAVMLPLSDGRIVEVGLARWDKGWDVVLVHCYTLSVAYEQDRADGLPAGIPTNPANVLRREIQRAVIAWREATPKGPTNDGYGWAPIEYL